jgi:hypothetical protein
VAKRQLPEAGIGTAPLSKRAADRRQREAPADPSAARRLRREHCRVAVGSNAKRDGVFLNEDEERRCFRRDLEGLAGDGTAEIGRVEEQLVRRLRKIGE